VRRLLLLTPDELTRDVRAVRAAHAALELGYAVAGACLRLSGSEPVELEGVRVLRAGRRGRVNRLWAGSPGTGRRGGVLVAELRGLLRLARLALRTVSLTRTARRLGPIDVVHANDLETLPAGVVLSRLGSARLVYDAHELYSEFEAPVPRLTRRLTLALERSLAHRADAVITVSDALAEELRQLLRLRQRPLVVLNTPRRADLIPRPSDGRPLRAVYQGRLGPGRALEDLLAAAEADGVELSLRIPLADVGELRAAVAGEGLAGRVHVLDPVDPDDVLDALLEFDVGILFDRPRTRNGELSMPNKLFEYLMAGLAVVAPRLESIGPLLEQERVGITYSPDDARGLPAALDRLAKDRPLLEDLRRRARELAMTRLNADAAVPVLREAWGERPGAC
jgi:glycosyltransferase involved in cell wall biosynthesis